MPTRTHNSLSLNLRIVKTAILRHVLLAAAIPIACVLVAGAYTATRTPTYLASASAFIENRSARILGKEFGDPMVLDRDWATAHQALARSRPVIDRAVTHLQELHPNATPQFDAAYSSVTSEGLLLYFNVAHENPEHARDMANAWMNAFLDEMADRQQSPLNKARAVVNTEMPKARETWMAKERELSQFMAENKFDSNPEQSHIRVRYEMVTQKVYESRLRLTTLRADMKQYLEAALNHDVIALLPRALHNGHLDELEKRIQEQKQKLYEVRINYSPESEIIKNVQTRLAQVEKERNDVLEGVGIQIRLDLKAAEDETEHLQELSKETTAEYETFKANSARYAQLVFEKDQAKTIYEELSRQTQQAHIEAEVQLYDARKWEIAEIPTSQFSPNWPRNLKTGVFMGLLLSLASIYILELLDDTVRTPSHLQSTLGIAPLGSILLLDKHWSRGGSYVVAQNHPQAAPVEGLRALRNQILMNYPQTGAGPGRNGVVIFVTSAVEGEGKSFLASNIGHLLATSKRQVLIIDLDLLRGTLSSAMGLRDEPGIAGIVNDPSQELNALVHQSTTPGLFILPAGRRASGSHSIDITLLEKTLNEARKQYDLIIVDSPPVLAVADSSTMAKLCDVVLMTVRCRVTRIAQAEQAYELLQKVKVKECAIVLNGLDERDAEAGDYGYYNYDYSPRQPEPGV